MGIVSEAWERARSGDLRGAAEAARKALAHATTQDATAAELHLVAASCAMRQGGYADALRGLDAAAAAAGAHAAAALRVDVWRAELAYFQGRYFAANEMIDKVLVPLEQARDFSYAAFALRIRIAILLARTDYAAIAAVAPRALKNAEAGRDPYVLIQVLNVLGAVSFDRATAKLADPHARSHLSLLGPGDAAPMEAEAREALGLFERARATAMATGYQYAAWYVAGNIERLEIILGRAGHAATAIRARLKVLQAKGASYDEIVARSNLAWALRTLGRHKQALHELDVALDLARASGTFNVLLEFLYYDRSVVLDALGQRAASRADYRRYVRMLASSGRGSEAASAATLATLPKRPLEPYFLKRADGFIAAHLAEPLTIGSLARHCGVSPRTLQKAFAHFRGITPVAHARNMRLEAAHRALERDGVSVAEAGAGAGFRSSTTFALEYRKRYGVPPIHTRRTSQRRQA
jgi:AraC-like DNA-binding protein